MGLWFVCLLMGFIKLDSLDVNLQAILIGNLLLLIIVYIGLVLFNGASINDHFMIHRDLLTKNKTHYAAIEDHLEKLEVDRRYINPLFSFAAKIIKSTGDPERKIQRIVELTSRYY